MTETTISLLFLATLILLPLAYFIPTVIALGKRDALAIFMLNLLVGWTFIGWVIALVWACRDDRI
jgi:hypothetical protein